MFTLNIEKKNQVIATKCFNTLILDYEFKADHGAGLPASVCCRVLCDGVFITRLRAKTRNEAIDKFLQSDY